MNIRIDDLRGREINALLEEHLLEKIGAHLNTGRPASTLALPLAPDEKIVQRLGIRYIRKHGPLFLGDLDDPVPAFGDAHHAANGWKIFRSQEPGRRPIGRNHEIFDDVLRAIPFLHFERLQ